jgi:hypothetical protein
MRLKYLYPESDIGYFYIMQKSSFVSENLTSMLRFSAFKDNCPEPD